MQGHSKATLAHLCLYPRSPHCTSGGHCSHFCSASFSKREVWGNWRTLCQKDMLPYSIWHLWLLLWTPTKRATLFWTDSATACCTSGVNVLHFVLVRPIHSNCWNLSNVASDKQGYGSEHRLSFSAQGFDVTALLKFQCCWELGRGTQRPHMGEYT